MDLQQFKDSLSKDQPQDSWNFLLKALWYDAKGDWHKAHDLADGPPGEEAAWVHAYLHRKEGDDWNANYWYRSAGRTMSTLTLEAEWEELVLYFLQLSTS